MEYGRSVPERNYNASMNAPDLPTPFDPDADAPPVDLHVAADENARYQAQFVAWFRAVAPYVHAFKRRTFVVAFGGEAAQAGRLARICEDLALLRALGIRVQIARHDRMF